MQNRFKLRYFFEKEKKIYDVVFIDFSLPRASLYVYGEDLLHIGKRDFKFENLIQSTGLKDKNNKLIYEGDIVKVNNKTIAIIEFYRGIFGCRFDKEKNDFSRFLGVGAYSDLEIEIIGNIYENPELLEVKC